MTAPEQADRDEQVEVVSDERVEQARDEVEDLRRQLAEEQAKVTEREQSRANAATLERLDEEKARLKSMLAAARGENTEVVETKPEDRMGTVVASDENEVPDTPDSLRPGVGTELTTPSTESATPSTPSTASNSGSLSTPAAADADAVETEGE